MKLECIKSLIGYDSCAQKSDLQNNLSLLFDEKFASAIAQHTQNAQDVYDKCIEVAAMKLPTLLSKYISNHFIEHTMEQVCHCTVEPKQFSAVGGASRGVVYTPNIGSNLQLPYLYKVFVHTKTEGVFKMTIEVDSTVIYKDVNLVVGKNEIELEGYYFKRYAKVYFDSTQNVSLGVLECSAKSCGCNGAKKVENKNEKFTISGYLNGNTNSTIYGISCCIEIVCNPEGLYCQYKQSLSKILFLLAAIEFNRTALETTRRNEYSLMNEKSRFDRIEIFTKEVQDSLEVVGKQLTSTISRYHGDGCITCEGIVRVNIN